MDTSPRSGAQGLARPDSDLAVPRELDRLRSVVDELGEQVTRMTAALSCALVPESPPGAESEKASAASPPGCDLSDVIGSLTQRVSVECQRLLKLCSRLQL